MNDRTLDGVLLLIAALAAGVLAGIWCLRDQPAAPAPLDSSAPRPPRVLNEFERTYQHDSGPYSFALIYGGSVEGHRWLRDQLSEVKKIAKRRE